MRRHHKRIVWVHFEGRTCILFSMCDSRQNILVFHFLHYHFNDRLNNNIIVRYQVLYVLTVCYCESWQNYKLIELYPRRRIGGNLGFEGVSSSGYLPRGLGWGQDSSVPRLSKRLLQANLDMTDSTGPGKLVRHMQHPSYTYDT